MHRHTIVRVSGAAFAAVALILGLVSPAAAASKPAQVTGFAAGAETWSARTVHLSWLRLSGATSYTLKWSTDSHFASPTWASTTATSIDVTNMTPGKPYYAVVTGRNAAGVGAYSRTLTFKLTPRSVSTFSSVTVSPVSEGVKVTFAAVPYASDYRVRWSAGPNENRVPDRWQEHYSAWFSAFRSDKTISYTVPSSAADLTAARYGNPIFVRVQARNTYYDSSYIRKSAQVHAWPSPPAVGAGADLRVASYNVMCSTCEPTGAPTWASRAPAIANLVNSVDPDVLTVSEASGPSAASGSTVAYLDMQRRLAHLKLTDSAAAPAGLTEGGTRTFYNPSKFRLGRTGYLPGVKDYRTFPEHDAPDISIPWAELTRISDSAKFIVVSAHFALPSSAYAADKKALLGRNAAQVTAALSAVAPANVPVLLGGDLNDHRYPENRADGAQATLIRAGFSDASAAVARNGTAKPTYNSYQPPAQQSDDPNQDGLRIDYLLTRGFAGSVSFTNHWNPGATLIPSDHNMIDAVVRLPHPS